MRNLKNSLSEAKNVNEKSEYLAKFLAENFNVNVEDVAILFEKVGALSFVFPSTLLNSAVPIDEKSTAGKTYVQKKTFIFNKFSEIQHVSLFEKFVKNEEFKSIPIQKIISTPFFINKEVVGVVQVSRKGQNPGDCIDFLKDDGIKVMEILREISGFFNK